MKKNTVTGVLLAVFALGAGLTAHAQTPEQRAQIVKDYDLKKLKELETRLAEKAETERAEAYRLAEINGWPITVTEKDGTYKDLQRVLDGKPVYFKTLNVGAAATARVNKINTGGGDGLELDGQNMIAGEWDAGKVRNTHVALTGIGRVTQQDGASNLVDHSTHVAGTMISSGAGDAQAKGLAWQAKLWANNWTNDTSEMANQAAQGLLVSNHSYGMDLESANPPLYYYGAYVYVSQDWDNITSLAPYYQPVVAAGNDRGSGFNPTKAGRDLLTEQATSKNVVVVAAVYEVPAYVNANSVQMSSFSNWGPTDDGRIKPDICTKGVDVYSTLSTSNTAFGYESGTSMASPGISASLLLLQQHYNNVNGHFMLSSTLRGIMAHTADEAGAISQPGPDHKFGWGLMNAEAGAKVISDNGTSSFILESTLTQGQTYTKTITSDGTPLKATLSWTDPVGNVNTGTVDLATPVLINDLDIRVTDGTTETLPWKLNTFSINSGAQRADNKIDNIEKIELPNAPVAGQTYTITVSHKGNLQGGSQKYSLIISGIGETAGIDENNALSKIAMWPNPANDVVTVSLGDIASDNLNIMVYDVQGREVVRKSNLYSSENRIDVSGLTPGIYMVEFSKGDMKYTRKLIKK